MADRVPLPPDPLATTAPGLAALAPYLRIVHDFAAGRALDLPRRAINDHALLYVRRGRGELRAGARRAALAPGTLLLVPPDREHAFVLRDAAGVEMLNVHFDPLVRGDSAGAHWHQDPRAPRRQRAEDLGVLPAAVTALPLRLPAAYEARFAALHARCPAADVAGALEARAAFLDLLAHALREAGGEVAGDDDDPGLERARAHLDRAAGAVTITELARVAHLGRSRLCAAFRRRYGLAPMAYLRRVRIERAKGELAYAGLTVKAVAARAGYASVHQFTRVFARLVGQPPATWRRARGR